MFRFGVTKQTLLDKYKTIIPYTEDCTTVLELEYNQILDALNEDAFDVYTLRSVIRTQNIDLIEEIFGDIILDKLKVYYDRVDWSELLKVFTTLNKHIKPFVDKDTYEDILDQFTNSFYHQLMEALESNAYFEYNTAKYIPVSSLTDLIKSLSYVTATRNRSK